MDLRALHYFVVVAEELNITRAAERLNMSQPPLSAQIKGLEEELGVQLFIRGKRHLTITDAGTHLYRRARQILALSEQTQQELMSMEGLSGDLHISLVEGRAPFLLARYVAGFRDEFPQVTYTIRTGGSDEILDQLRHHLIDIAVIAAPFDLEQLDGIALGKQPWVAIIPRQHPLAAKEGETIDLAELADEPLIVPERPSRVRAIDHRFSSLGLTPAFLCRTSNYLNALALAEQNAGICIFPQSTYTPNPHVVTKLITNPPKIAEYFLVWPKDAILSELSEAFRDYVQDFIDEDRLHSDRFRTREQEFEIPKEADLL